METKIIEASDCDKFNWGKFLIGRFDHEWERRAQILSALDGPSLIGSQGWGPEDLLVMDLSVGHAAMFTPRAGALPHVDVENTGIYFCPLFRGFMEWLYRQDLQDLSGLPDYVELDPVYMIRGPAPGEYQGGPDGADIQD